MLMSGGNTFMNNYFTNSSTLVAVEALAAAAVTAVLTFAGMLFQQCV